MPVSRSQFVSAAGAFALASTSRPAFAADAPLVTLKVGATTNDVAQAVFYAESLGYFKKVGLDVQIQTLRSGAAEAAAVASSALDIGECNVLTLANAHAKGIPLKFIAAAGEYVSSAATTVMVVPKNSPLKTAKDLTGKTVGTSALKDLIQVATANWIDKNGGDSKTVKFIELSSPEMAPALERGTIDAATIPEPSLTIAKANARVFARPFDAIATHFMIDGWFARTEWIDQNRDVVKRFVSAVVEASRWGNKNHAASAKILEAHTKIEPAVLEAMTRATYGDKLHAEYLQPVIELAVRYDVIAKSFPASEIYEVI